MITDDTSVDHKNSIQKDVQTMAVIYATLIVKGKKTFADVPDRIKDKVKEVLVDLDCPELAE